MLPTFDTSSKVKLLNLLPESSWEGGNKCSLEEYTLQTCPAYHVLDYLPVQDDDRSSSILINGKELAIETTLAHALSVLAHQAEPRKLWIESLCLDPLHTLSPKQLSQLQKCIRTNAKVVIIWIGRDHEDDDILRGYLGTGSASSTESAFSVCQSIANIEDPQEDLRPWLEIKAEHSQRAMLCHLANLLYRPWFRELPLLKTSYLDEISSLLVRCGNRTIDWASIKVAAERIRMIEPIPHLVLDLSEEAFSNMSSIKDWLDARENFGMSAIHLICQALWLVKNMPEGQSNTDGQGSNMTSFLATIYEITDFDYDKLWAIRQSIQDTIDKEDAREHAPITLASLQSPKPLPTRPIRQALIPPPDPEYQAPYVHKPMNNGTFALFKLFPHGNNPDTPVQGSMISVPLKEAPSFLYVSNATLKNYRRNSLILVDGQSFLVPEALDIFLRRVRDTADEKLLFIWKICWNPDEADVPGDRRGVSALTKYMIIAKKLVSRSAGCIDMYEILTEAAEEVANKLGGVPNEYDWLLDLLDEAQINDLPATKSSEEEALKQICELDDPSTRSFVV